MKIYSFYTWRPAVWIATNYFYFWAIDIVVPRGIQTHRSRVYFQLESGSRCSTTKPPRLDFCISYGAPIFGNPKNKQAFPNFEASPTKNSDLAMRKDDARSGEIFAQKLFWQIWRQRFTSQKICRKLCKLSTFGAAFDKMAVGIHDNDVIRFWVNFETGNRGCVVFRELAKHSFRRQVNRDEVTVKVWQNGDRSARVCQYFWDVVSEVHLSRGKSVEKSHKLRYVPNIFIKHA